MNKGRVCTGEQREQVHACTNTRECARVLVLAFWLIRSMPSMQTENRDSGEEVEAGGAAAA